MTWIVVLIPHQCPAEVFPIDDMSELVELVDYTGDYEYDESGGLTEAESAFEELKRDCHAGFLLTLNEAREFVGAKPYTGHQDLLVRTKVENCLKGIEQYTKRMTWEDLEYTASITGKDPK